MEYASIIITQEIVMTTGKMTSFLSVWN